MSTTADKLPTTVGQARSLRLRSFSAMSIEKNLTDAQMQAVATYVRDLGGGFLLAGGENTYGKEGYTGSTIEEILPVTFETRRNGNRSRWSLCWIDRAVWRARRWISPKKRRRLRFPC